MRVYRTPELELHLGSAPAAEGDSLKEAARDRALHAKYEAQLALAHVEPMDDMIVPGDLD